jgi:hypothetical protein
VAARHLGERGGHRGALGARGCRDEHAGMPSPRLVVAAATAALSLAATAAASAQTPQPVVEQQLGGGGRVVYYDADCDGRAETVKIDADGDGFSEVEFHDWNGDGRFDWQQFDADGNGRFDPGESRDLPLLPIGPPRRTRDGWLCARPGGATLVAYARGGTTRMIRSSEPVGSPRPSRFDVRR